ncbi:Outer membrane receptor proteins, mostly Fe transport [Mucilaginibacter gossypiicola]|uniref:Outer membrane receptor proteins, mostly Fe transport n=1 Tax=Mucilaginibacter gossypiicola TaxID=551995 RepID=A0A1H8RUN7_9SPHI|nr:TonB-dependent receptor [Mucilaginibacter gossypiicola]SEO70072.1 Outer membrane receptor proteins, mostly Fe transport [Mucilaginibacter gossypiicola]
MKRYLILLITFILIKTLAYSQTTIQGTVTDAITHEAIAGASICNADVQNSAKLGMTNAKGHFSINAQGITRLKFAMVGYSALIIEVSAIKGQKLDIALEPSMVDLQPVVVTASREGQARQDAPIAISKINSTQIKDTKATALYQLLNKVAGVYMVNLGNEQHTMAIRQPITYNALYLYMEDGVPIRPTGIFNHNSLYEINMSGVKDIEVIKGPASSLYGSNSIGGAVNFITQGPPTGYAGNVSVQGDNYHYRRVDADGGFTQGKFGLYIGGYVAHQADSWQDYSDFDKYSANFKTTYDFSAKTKLTTSAAYNYLNTQTPGSLDSTRFYNRSYGANQRFTYRKVKSFRASTRLDHQWDDKNSTFVTLFFRGNSTAQLPSYYISDVRDANGVYQSSNGQVNDQKFNSYGLLAQHRVDFDFLHSRLIGGVYMDDSPSSYYAQYLDITKDVANNYYTSFTNTGRYIDNYKIKLFNTAAYVQYEIKPLEALRIVGGLRYDRVHYNFDNEIPAGQTKYKQQETNNFNIVAPKLGITYNFGNNKGLYANYSVGFQPPETGDLYSSRQLTQLKQATFDNYEAGGWFSAFNKKLYFELSIFDLEGHNEIINQLLPDNTTQNQNAGATRHRGIEYSLTVAPVKELTFRFSGTNARHTYVEYSEVTTNYTTGTNTVTNYDGKRMNNAPAWIANSELTYKPQYLPGFRIATEWQHINQYYTNPANTKTYSGYDIYNLRLGYDVKSSVLKGAGIWFNVLNLTNKLYATTVTSSQYGDTYNAAPPRTYTLGISYSFSKY